MLSKYFQQLFKGNDLYITLLLSTVIYYVPISSLDREERFVHIVMKKPLLTFYKYSFQFFILFNSFVQEEIKLKNT